MTVKNHQYSVSYRVAQEIAATACNLLEWPFRFYRYEEYSELEQQHIYRFFGQGDHERSVNVHLVMTDGGWVPEQVIAVWIDKPDMLNRSAHEFRRNMRGNWLFEFGSTDKL